MATSEHLSGEIAVPCIEHPGQDPAREFAVSNVQQPNLAGAGEDGEPLLGGDGGGAFLGTTAAPFRRVDAGQPDPDADLLAEPDARPAK